MARAVREAAKSQGLQSANPADLDTPSRFMGENEEDEPAEEAKNKWPGNWEDVGS